MSLIRRTSGTCALAAVLGFAAAGQTPGSSPEKPNEPQPIYRVTVVSRTLQAVNYEHRGGPTLIDFNGTVLLPHAKGQAIVESKRGRITIDAKLERMDPPTKYGAGYLTYVLWAITPEGRAKNLGEVLVDSSNKAHINVTSDLQAFGLVITAEPYFSVTMPSDVVVMENTVRPDTIGMRELITARYDLLPRKEYVMNLQPGTGSGAAVEGRKVSYDEYEALLELYQAENAVQIARAAGADRFAPESFNKAVTLLNNARQMQARTHDTHMVVSTAREAAQTAEDARVIAVRRLDLEHQREVQRSQDESRQQVKTEIEREQYSSSIEHRGSESEPVERDEPEPARRETVQSPPPPVTARPVQPTKYELTGTQRKDRAELLAQLNSSLHTLDSPRGLVVMVPDAMFQSAESDAILAPALDQLMRVGMILRSQPGLTIRVEGFTDREQDRDLSRRRAEAVRLRLIREGLGNNSVTAIGYGNSRPVESNATESGRRENRRVEIVISGPRIGDMALWDRTYSLKSQR